MMGGDEKLRRLYIISESLLTKLHGSWKSEATNDSLHYQITLCIVLLSTFMEIYLLFFFNNAENI